MADNMPQFRETSRAIAGLLKRGEVVQAERDLWDAVGRYPDAAEFGAMLARLLYKRGEVSQSATLWKKVVATESVLPLNWCISAVSVLFASRAKPEAQDALAKGLSAYPGDKVLHRIAATEAKRTNQIDEAIAHLQAMSHGEEIESAMAAELAPLLLRKGDYKAAVALWDRVEGLAARVASLRILIDNGELSDAEARLTVLTPAQRKSVLALTEEARLRHRQGELRQSVQLWLELAEGVDDPKPYSQAASILRILGDETEAERLIGCAMTISSRTQPRHFWGSSTKGEEDPVFKATSPSGGRNLSGSLRRPSWAHIDAAIESEKTGGRSGILQYPSELRFLARFLKQNRIESFFEVGMRHGELALFLKRVLGLKRVGGSELILKERLERNMQENALEVFVGDHTTSEYLAWRSQRTHYDFIFIDGDHSYHGVATDFAREKKFRPKFIGFHDIWNIAYLGCKHFWDEQEQKVAEYCNVDPDEIMLVTSRLTLERRVVDNEIELSGYCAGIGIVRVDQ